MKHRLTRLLEEFCLYPRRPRNPRFIPQVAALSIQHLLQCGKTAAVAIFANILRAIETCMARCRGICGAEHPPL
jgi:hypothetical protein